MEKNIIKLKRLPAYYFLLKSVILLQILKYSKLVCEETLPFLKGNECVDFCTAEEVKNKLCEITDEKLKTQWINNIIYFKNSNKYWGYINGMTTQFDDLIILVSSFSARNQRLLFGITKDGRGYFNESKYHMMEINDPDSIGRFESEAFMVKLKEKTSDKEYILSFGKGVQFLEIYDIESNKIYFKPIWTSFLQLADVHQISGAYLKVSSDGYNSYLIGLLATDFSDQNSPKSFLILFTFQITSLSDEDIILEFEQKQQDTYNSKMLSCYETNEKSIVCFFKYTHSLTASYTSYYYTLSKDRVYTENIHTINKNNKDEERFFKCVHYYSEIGAFIYYNDDDIPKAIIHFYELKSSSGCFNSKCKIELNYNFDCNNLLNDIVKLSEGKIFFAAASNDKKSLYIVSIHNIEITDIHFYYIERIYHVNSLIYNDFAFNDTIRLTIFNNYLALCSNGLTNAKVTFSSLIIFSYPNSTDLRKEITHLLLNDNEININNITIDLKNLCLIENNIFGHVLIGVKIIDIYKSSCDAYLISLSNNKEISKEQLLPIDDKLKLVIQKNGDIYNKFTYGIKYSCFSNVSSYDKHNSYPIAIEDKKNKGKEIFNSEIHSGRHTYYNFSLDNQLTEEGCNEGCELCYYLDKTKCITCNLGLEFEFLDDNKICLIEQESTQLMTAFYESETIQKEEATTSEITTYMEKYLTDSKTSHSEFDISTNEKVIKEANTNEIVDTSKTFDIITEFISQKHSYIHQCNVKEIIQGKCKGILTDEMAEEIYYYIKNNLINSNFTDDYLLITTPSYKFHLSTQEFINTFRYLNTSKVDLGECENKLKKKYNISDEYSLIIFKIDIENSDKSYTFVQYEVFNPETYRQLNLDICDNIMINITIPAKIDNETLFLYERLKSYGYNLFDADDKFYNDICTKYTTENNTDMLLSDRKNDIFSKYGNKSICQDGCYLGSYNNSLEEATCQCKVQTTSTDLDLNIRIRFNMKGLNQAFFKTLNNSNFRVLKCYYVAIDLNNVSFK